MVYEATIKNGQQSVVFYLLLELQRTVDFRMPYRLLLYIVEILRHYYNNADKKVRRRKGFEFPAVVPIVFYSGGRRWTSVTSLREMFGGSLINFDYAVVNVAGYDHESVKDFSSRLLKVMMMLEKSKNVQELFGVIERYEGDIKLFDEEELRIIITAVEILGRVCGEDEAGKISDAIMEIRKEGRSSMLSDLVANEKKRERQLINQGREQERVLYEQEKLETAKTLLDMGLSVEQVSFATKLTIERVMEIKNALLAPVADISPAG